METRRWTFVDKSTWGEGPWHEEHCDKVQWSDAGTGLPCLAVRGPMGHWCGYVGLAPGSPFYGLAYGACALRPETCGEDFCAHAPEQLLKVHGGLTFSAACGEGGEDHGICHVPSPGEETRVWWLGFDAAHAGDYSPGSHVALPQSPWEQYRSLAYIQGQCARLAAQLDDRDWEERLAEMRADA
jgi:hypothetical protein